MTNKVITKGQIRQAILQLIHIEVPEESKLKNNDLHSILLDQKYAAVDFACSMLQGDFEIDLQHVLQQNKAEIKRITDIGLGSFDEVKLQGLEKRINELLMLLEEYRLQQYAQVIALEDRTPSFQELSHTIYIAQGQLEAESIRLFLQSFGISARIAQESAGVVLGLTVGSLGEADVRVSPSDAQDAGQLLKAMKEGFFIFPEDMDTAPLSDEEPEEE